MRLCWVRRAPRAGVRASIVAKKRGNSRGVKGGVWFSLIDKIQRPKTLNAAWAAVKRNGGGAGSDHQGIEDFEKDLGGEIERLSEALRTADGGYRRLYSRWTCAGAGLNILSTATNRPLQWSINGYADVFGASSASAKGSTASVVGTIIIAGQTRSFGFMGFSVL